MSPSASCGHAAASALGRNVPIAAVSRCSNTFAGYSIALVADGDWSSMQNLEL